MRETGVAERRGERRGDAHEEQRGENLLIGENRGDLLASPGREIEVYEARNSCKA